MLTNIIYLFFTCFSTISFKINNSNLCININSTNFDNLKDKLKFN